MGHADEALTSLTAWAAEKPGEQRWGLLALMRAKAGRTLEAREALAKAAELGDKVRKTDLQIQLAAFDTQHGDATLEKAALAGNFLTKKDSQSFQRYWRFLSDRSWLPEAHALFVTNKDNGYFEQYQQSDFVALCLDYSDYSSAADLNWRFSRYGNRWERDSYFDRVAKTYRDHGKMNWFINDFVKRVQEDATANESLWDRIARSWDQYGYPEKALSVYERQLQRNPFNRIAVQNKARLLVKLGRTDEAIQLLRDPKGMVSLDLESNAQIALVELLFKLDRKADGLAEIAALLAWDKRPATLTRVGNLLMDQKEYEKAVELFERAIASVRDWNYEELLLSLAKGRAKLGKVDDLNKSTEEFMGSGNADYRLQSLQGWLLSEGFPDVAAKVIQSRLAKSPDKIELYVALAGAQQDAGQTNEVFGTFDASSKALPNEQMGDVRARFASFLVERQLVAEAIKRREVKDSPLVTGALIELFNRTDEKAERAKLLSQAAAKFQTDDPELQVWLGDALAKHKLMEEAAAWYRRALTSTNEMTRGAAAVGLALSTGDKASVPILAELLRSKPHWFTPEDSPGFGGPASGQVFYGPVFYPGMPQIPYTALTTRALESDKLITAVAKTGDIALIDRLNQVLQATVLHDAEREYWAAVVTYGRGLTNEARTKLASLTDAPKLSSGQLQKLGTLAENLAMAGERAKLLQRLTTGGSPTQARWQAFADLVKLHTKAANFRRRCRHARGNAERLGHSLLRGGACRPGRRGHSRQFR